MSNRVDIVIVNWNSGTQLSECVASILLNCSNEVSRIIVVDNGSADGSAQLVCGCKRVKVLHIPINLGFSAACNLGSRLTSSPYILFLNPDTRLLKDSLKVPLAFMEESENIGICGIQLVDATGMVAQTCARFPSLRRFMASALGMDKWSELRGAGVQMLDWNHNETRRVDHVMGAFFFVRRSVFETLGGFDERFFMYFEDVDFSFRARRAGWRSVYLAESQAFHAGGGTSRQVKALRLFYSLRSRLLYGFKHFPSWEAWALTAVTCLIEPVTRTLYCLARGDRSGVLNTWKAYRMLYSGLGRIIRGEGRFQP